MWFYYYPMPRALVEVIFADSDAYHSVAFLFRLDGACLLVHGRGAWPYVRDCRFENIPCHGIIVEEHAKVLHIT